MTDIFVIKSTTISDINSTKVSQFNILGIPEPTGSEIIIRDMEFRPRSRPISIIFNAY